MVCEEADAGELIYPENPSLYQEERELFRRALPWCLTSISGGI